MSTLAKKFTEKIYILESLDKKNEKNLLKEAVELKKFLNYEGIEYEMYQFTSADDLKKYLAKAGGEISLYREKTGIQYLPFLHFICHGNELGIGATQRDATVNLIDWNELNKILYSFSYNADLFGKEKLSNTLKRELNLDVSKVSKLDKKIFDGLNQQYTYCLTFLVLTSCNGGTLALSNLKELNNFSFLIGSKVPTYSQETSCVFQKFYKDFNKEENFLSILKKMNTYITEGKLEVFVSKEMIIDKDELNLLGFDK